MKENEKKWKAVSIGGVTGIMIGAGATFAATQPLMGENMADEHELEKVEDTELDTGINNEETEADAVAQSETDEALSFSDAFAAARRELGVGGVFEWNGNKYTTYTEDEWAQLKEQDQEQLIAGTSDAKEDEFEPTESALDDFVEEPMLVNEPEPNDSASDDPIEGPLLVDNDAQISDVELVDNPEVRFLGENPEEIIDGGNLVDIPNDDETLAENLNDGEILVDVPNDGETYEVYASVETEEDSSETSSLIQDSLHTLADENNNIPTSESIEDVVMNDDDTMIDIESDIDNAIIV